MDFPVELPVEKRGEHWYARAGDRTLRLSNLTKVFWPDEGYTKGDLLSYYFNISPVMLPHLEERPLTLKRMPNGATGEFFYEKNAPSHTPEWMPTYVVPSEEGRPIRYLSVCDPAHMLWVVNLGCIEFHPLHGRGADQEHPSYAFFDLDPFEPATFDDVKHVALLVKVVLDQLGLRAYPKTSGATGMQIMVPLDGTVDYDMVRGFVGAVSDLVHAADRSTTTLEWETRKRAGKVFLDATRAGGATVRYDSMLWMRDLKGGAATFPSDQSRGAGGATPVGRNADVDGSRGRRRARGAGRGSGRVGARGCAADAGRGAGGRGGGLSRRARRRAG